MSKNNIFENKTENVNRPAQSRDANESKTGKKPEFGQCYQVDKSISIFIIQFGSLRWPPSDYLESLGRPSKGDPADHSALVHLDNDQDCDTGSITLNRIKLD